jgi:hypothetical protein
MSLLQEQTSYSISSIFFKGATLQEISEHHRIIQTAIMLI